MPSHYLYARNKEERFIVICVYILESRLLEFQKVPSDYQRLRLWIFALTKLAVLKKGLQHL